MQLASQTGERKKSTAFRGIGSMGSFAAVRLRTVMFGDGQAAWGRLAGRSGLRCIIRRGVGLSSVEIQWRVMRLSPLRAWQSHRPRWKSGRASILPYGADGILRGAFPGLRFAPSGAILVLSLREVMLNLASSNETRNQVNQLKSMMRMPRLQVTHDRGRVEEVLFSQPDARIALAAGCRGGLVDSGQRLLCGC